MPLYPAPPPAMPDPAVTDRFKVLDYMTFPKVVGELFRDQPGFEGVRYTQNFPRQQAEVPAIAYRLVRRTPGMDGIETRKSRLRTSLRHGDGTTTEIWSQWMTCLYQFDVCHFTGPQVDTLGYEFDLLMRDSVGVFLKLGASEVVFDEQLEDAMLPQSDEISVRSLRWLVRLDQLEFRRLPSIQQFRVRQFLPQEEGVETLTRGQDLTTLDLLDTTYISKIVFCSDPSPSGIARQDDYLEGIDFVTVYDPLTAKTKIQWLEPGKSPAPGATYLVRFCHWTAFARPLALPL